MPDLDQILENAMTEIERKEQIKIWYKDMKQLLIEARDREYSKIDTGVSNETVASVKNRFDMYFYYLEYFFKKSQE